MRHLFYRTKLLIIIYTLTAMLLSLGSMAYMKHLHDSKAFEQLSPDYIMGFVTSAEENPDLRGVLLDTAKRHSDTFLIAADFTGIRAFAVYYTDPSLFSMELKEGRLFQIGDFENGRDVALVNKTTAAECARQDGKLWWNYGGTLFEVIGVYEDEDSFGGRTADCFLNLTAESLDTSIFSSFLFDAGRYTESDFSAIRQEISSRSGGWYIDGAPVGSEEAGEFSVSGSNFGAMFLLLLLIAALILLNSISEVGNWLQVRRKEIAVRRLCGASAGSIVFWIWKNLLALILISFAAGTALARCILEVGMHTAAAESVQMMFGLHLQWFHVFLSFVAVILFCTATAFLAVRQFRKQEIAEETA